MTCGVLYDNVDFEGTELQSYDRIPGVEVCCQLCLANTRCVAWTWGKKRNEAYTDTCYLKASSLRGEVRRIKNDCCVSGEVWGLREQDAFRAPGWGKRKPARTAPSNSTARPASAAAAPLAAAAAAETTPPAGGAAEPPPSAPTPPETEALLTQAQDAVVGALRFGWGAVTSAVGPALQQPAPPGPGAPVAAQGSAGQAPPPQPPQAAPAAAAPSAEAPPAEAAAAAAAAAAAQAAAAAAAAPPSTSAVVTAASITTSSRTATTLATVTETPQSSCGLIEAGVDYPGNDLVEDQDGDEDSSVAEAVAQGPGECCERCTGNDRCYAWVWLKAAGHCFLKGNSPRTSLAKISNDDAVSGQPSQVGRSIATTDPGDRSVLCLSLVIPWTEEKELIAGQFEGGFGIFECDEYAVYSNEELDLAPGLRSRKIDSDLVCEKGGEFGTALNTDIFLALWAKVLDEGRFMLHGWTAKVDPDAVFLPNRLRSLLTRHSEDPRGLYLNNCKLGMHGPLEVFSRNALQALGRGKEQCLRHFTRLCSGPCKWGEDMFLDQCLSKVLNVTREFEWALLQEDHCDPPPGWQACNAPGIAAFHPFKTVKGYRDCMDSANAVDAA